MLDIRFVRENADIIRKDLLRRKDDARLAALQELLEKDAQWRKRKGDCDLLRAQRNKLSLEVNEAKKRGGDIKPIIEEVKLIPQRIKEHEETMLALEKEVAALLARIPNVMHESVPLGESDADNVEVKRWGAPRQFPFPVRSHVEIAERLGLVDFEASAKTTGNGFYFLKGDLALLNTALIRFAVETLTAKGYTYIEPPLMVRKGILEAAMDLAAIRQSVYMVRDAAATMAANATKASDADGTGQSHTGMRTGAFAQDAANDGNDGDGDGDALCLIGTAEHAILGMHAGMTIGEDDLPLRYAGYSMCFRQEIGSHGIDEKGLWRTHQFNKVEQFIFCMPQQGEQLYDELFRNGEEILQALELPYRVVEICVGDLAAWKSRSHDFEVWRPTTGAYGEVMSLSDCTAYQANDLGIRYVKRNGDRGTLHTLNNTALATSRIMVAILENMQEEDGSVVIPEVLRKHMGGKDRLTPTKRVQRR